MKKILFCALAAFAISSTSFAATYICESEKVEVIAEPIADSMQYNLQVTDNATQEVIYQDEASAYLGSGVDATFSVPGEVILIIDAAGYGDLTFKTTTYSNLECEIN